MLLCVVPRDDGNKYLDVGQKQKKTRTGNIRHHTEIEKCVYSSETKMSLLSGNIIEYSISWYYVLRQFPK